MGSERRSMSEQELSIKEREEQLFVEAQQATPEKPPTKPFPVYLRETPAVPLTTGEKAVLWVVGIVVVVLFAAALLRIQRSAVPRPGARLAQSAVAPLAPPAVYPHRRQDGTMPPQCGVDPGTTPA